MFSAYISISRKMNFTLKYKMALSGHSIADPTSRSIPCALQEHWTVCASGTAKRAAGHA
ncbi:protein of unknown function [Brevefilum fermentans]|jgi:hypothetical protein|uniref:Uncharacterized protein n=1 Tax=Candidatus Brevifilum fermentans TaxID=1986204 RepID=A0A1Y6K2Z3_9CHLR|nr:protein of unknown function [Brevefilum fermentans]